METVASAPKKNKKKWLIGFGILAIIVVIGFNVIQAQRKKADSVQNVKTEVVTMKKMGTTKLISGEVKAANVEDIYQGATIGNVEKIFVKKGQTVAKGDKLLQYESGDMDLQIKQLELETKMLNIRDGQEKTKLSQLEKEKKKLKEGNAPSESIQAIQDQINELSTQRELTALDFEKNKLQHQALEKKKKETVLYSNINGIVDTVGSLNGIPSAENVTPFIRIISKDAFVIEGTVNEFQKNQLKIGQIVKVKAKAIKDKEWTGKIVEIGDYPVSSNIGNMQGNGENVSAYAFKVSLNDSKELIAGYHVSLEVEIDLKELVSIPTNAIVTEETPYVFVKKDGKVKKVEVETGMTDGEWTEIIKGVSIGEEVVTKPSSTLRDGMDVSKK